MCIITFIPTITARAQINPSIRPRPQPITGTPDLEVNLLSSVQQALLKVSQMFTSKTFYVNYSTQPLTSV